MRFGDVVVLSLCLFSTASCLPTSKAELLQHAYSPSSLNTSPTCTIIGNQDLYGLSIRLGVYFQLLSTLIANHFLPEALGEAWDTSAVFLVAILIAIVKSSAGSEGFTSPEEFVMLQMMLAFLLAVFNISNSAWSVIEKASRFFEGSLGIGSRMRDLYSDVDNARNNASELGKSTRLVLALGISAYNVWFWYGGSARLDTHLHCTPKMFFFARVDVHGALRVVYMILAMVYLVLHILQTAVDIFPLPLIRKVLISGRFWREHPCPALLDWKLWLPFMNPVPELARKRERPSEGRSLGVRRLYQILDRAITLMSDTSQSPVTRKYDHRSRLWERTVRFSQLTTLWSSAAVIVRSVLAIELTLIWIGIQGIYSIGSTGQLIPFIIGVAGILRTAVQIFVQLWLKRVMQWHFRVG